MDKLEIFIGHLSGNLQLDDQIFVSFKSAEIAMAELKVYSPLLATNLGNLVRVRDFFKNKAAFGSPISMESCLELSRIATNAKEKHRLAVLGYNEGMYENMKDRYGLKWADLFDIFPSLSQVVTIDFLLCNMKKNHVRSYSIASCKVSVNMRTFVLFLYLSSSVCSFFF